MARLRRESPFFFAPIRHSGAFRVYFPYMRCRRMDAIQGGGRATDRGNVLSNTAEFPLSCRAFDTSANTVAWLARSLSEKTFVRLTRSDKLSRTRPL